MFDNLLFSSLIPQFLMVFGFISCLIAPALSSPISTDEISVENKIVITTENNSVNQSTVTAYFSDFVTDETVKCIINPSYSSTLSVPFSEYPLLIFDVAFFHISRPPPFSV